MQELIAGRYRILKKIGEGGMGEVYAAMDERLQRQVALKRLHVLGGSESKLETFKARFQREAVSMARFNHPSIVPVYDYGDDADGIFLVMGYMPGGSLGDRMGYPVDPKMAIQYLLPVAEALAFIHKHGLIHRDIKPQNILFNEHGSPMLADFGIVKLMSEEAVSITTTGTAGVGTPAYMAPEQITTHFDHRVDQYALGIILYELITGRVPFEGDTPVMTLLMHSTEPLTDPRVFAPELPEAMVELVKKALAKQPDERYADMDAFRKVMKVVWSQLPGETVLPEYEEISSPESASTPASNADETRVGIPSQIRTKNQPLPATDRKAVKKKSRVWLWVMIGLVVILGLLVLGGIVRRIRSNRAEATGQVLVAPVATGTPQAGKTPVLPAAEDAKISLSFSGLTALQHLTERLQVAFAETHPDWEFDITGGGSSSGILAAGRNAVDFGMARRVLNEGDWARFPRLNTIAVALDAVYVGVHPENPVGSLSLFQLKGILSGEITNWSDVGGADAPIMIAVGPLDADSQLMLEMLIAGDLAMDKPLMIKEQPGEVYEATAGDPHVLGIVFSQAPRNNNVRLVPVNEVLPDEETIHSRAYPLVIELVYVVNGEPSSVEQTWLEFVFSAEGNRLVREGGFIPAK